MGAILLASAKWLCLVLPAQKRNQGGGYEKLLEAYCKNGLLGENRCRLGNWRALERGFRAKAARHG